MARASRVSPLAVFVQQECNNHIRHDYWHVLRSRYYARWQWMASLLGDQTMPSGLPGGMKAVSKSQAKGLRIRPVVILSHILSYFEPRAGDLGLNCTVNRKL